MDPLIQQLQTKNDDLVQENAALRKDNERLREANEQLKDLLNDSLQRELQPDSLETHGTTLPVDPRFQCLVEPDAIIRSVDFPCDSPATDSVVFTKNHRGNVLCSLIVDGAHRNRSAVLSCGADKTLCLVDRQSNAAISLHLDAPGICMQLRPSTEEPNIVAVGTLSGSIVLVQVGLGDDDQWYAREQSSVKVHQKHVTSVAWSPCGRWFVSASRDEQVVLFRWGGVGGGKACELGAVGTQEQAVGAPDQAVETQERAVGTQEQAVGAPDQAVGAQTQQQPEEQPQLLVQEQVLKCTGCPESVIFLPAFSKLCAVIAVRDNSCLHFLGVDELPHDVVDYQCGLGNTIDVRGMKKVNIFDGDSHVSFNILDMAAAPDWQPFFVCATDKNRNIVMEAGTCRKLRDLYGHSNGEYSRPRVAWHASGEWVLGNSENDHAIYVWSQRTGQLAGKLAGHQSSVRGVVTTPQGEVCTCSFDGSVRCWDQLRE